MAKIRKKIETAQYFWNFFAGKAFTMSERAHFSFSKFEKTRAKISKMPICLHKIEFNI